MGDDYSVLAKLYNAPSSTGTGSNWLSEALKKRRAFFSFHYDDIMRVNNVRNAWKIHHADSETKRSFQDSSLWESKKLEGDEAVKKLIREGVEYTSAVCVLIGTHTWSRRWVKYEIARSVIDERGLLGVHINSLNHHERRTPDNHGYNPLEMLGVFKNPNGQHYLYENTLVTDAYGQTKWEWHPYKDYTQSVSVPRYLTTTQAGYVTPLSHGTTTHCFVSHTGHTNLGAWIDNAAQKAGR